MRLPSALILLMITPIFGVQPFLALGGEEVQFNRDIRPILSDKCYQCHGPDSAARQADLRLDDEAGLRSTIEVGDALSSELIVRIRHIDGDEKMPPPESGQTLTESEVQLLETWVQQGANWEKHWAFLPPVRPTPPEVKRTDWVKTPIDTFTLSRMESLGLAPSGEANKTSLLRRVTFDLTGLPPTMSEIKHFLADKSPRAYERVVDRLLSSPRYGERMAIEWLDASRYADSHGYSLDRRRVMWPWRDWVIQAFQSNLPYDEFIIEQLAGDLIPDATISQKIATGFNRNHPIQSEGGVINEEYRVETVVDRVETTAATLLGLTMGCARCHDHKYEQISQKEFFEFYAFFNNLPETAHVGNRDNDVDAPSVLAPTERQAADIAELEAEIPLARELAKQSLEDPKRIPVETIWFDDELPEGAKPFGNGSGPQEFTWVEGDSHQVLSGKRSSHRTCDGRGQQGFEGARPLLIGEDAELFISIFIDPDDPPKEIMLQWIGQGAWDHRAYWGEDLIDWGQNETTSRRPMGALPEAGKWIRLNVKASDVGLPKGGSIHGWALTQFGGTVHWDVAGVVSIPQTAEEIRLGELEQALKMVRNAQPRVMVMAEMEKSRKTFVLNRGQYDQPTEISVQPNIPAVLGSLSQSDGSERAFNRLDLAKWMVSKGNPLTARVAVNRFWQIYFGDGIVLTPEDFGAQGALPSNQGLLDWLVAEFVDSGWDVKALQKQIVMSATYRQSSNLSPVLLEKDPNNRFLARGPRFRLSGEMIRDQALFISGLLVDQVGGPSVRPYQPPGLWDDVVYGNVPRFQQDHGAKLYRRSVYTYWKRSVPPPNLQVFDAPSREACVLKRSRTNTPLAALVLMNDPTFVEASRKLAELTLKTVQGDDAEKLSWIFQRATSRRPTEQQMALLKSTLKKAMIRYRDQPHLAKELMSVGESSHDSDLSTAQIAAFSAIASALLNTDEVITKN